jgi:hypothetical protein
MLLSSLEQRPDIAATLHDSFERMLAKYRKAQSSLPAPKPRPKRDYRRRKRV